MAFWISGAPVMHGDGAVAQRRCRDQLEPSRAGHPALIEGRAVAGDLGVHQKLILVDQIQPVQFGRELAATQDHAGRGRVLEPLHARAQVAGDVVAVGPWEGLSRRRHHIFRLGLQLDRPLAYRRRRRLVASGECRPVALHHLVGYATPQHQFRDAFCRPEEISLIAFFMQKITPLKYEANSTYTS